MHRLRTGCRDRLPAAHPAQAGHCLLTITLTLLALLSADSWGAGAQEGTPTSPDTISAAECTVQPRALDELRTLFRETAATPIPATPQATPTPAVAPTGVPAGAQTVAEISATWRQYLACIVAADQARMFALSSDDMVRRQFVIDRAFGVTEDALFAYLAATPAPLPPDQAVTFVPITEARVLADGRVAVVGPGEGGRGDVRIFVKRGDRWLLDDWFDLS